MLLKNLFPIISIVCATWLFSQTDSIQPVANEPKPEIIPLQKLEVKGKQVEKEGSAKSGYRHKSAQVGPLGNIPLKEIPYSINVTSGELIENRAAHTPQEALKTNPTVANLMQSNQYSGMSRVMIRGFNASDQSELRDGLSDRSFCYAPMEQVERIEVMNGMSGFLYGFSSLGGTVNYISKQPVDQRLANFSIGQYNNGLNFVQADLGGPLSKDSAKALTYRALAFREDGNTFIDDGKQQRTLLYGAMNYRLSDKTTLQTNIWRQNHYVTGLTTLFAVDPLENIPIPDAFDPSVQYGQSWTYNKSEKTVLGLAMNSEISPALTVRAAYRYGDMWRQYKYIAAKLIDSKGTYREQLIESPRQGEFTHSAYALADTKFKTAFLHHSVTFGYQGSAFYYSRGDDKKTWVAETSHVDNPMHFNDTALGILGTNTWQSQNQDNILIGDRIDLKGFFSIFAGVNYAEIRQKARSTATSAAISTSNFIQGKFSPSLALTYKPASFVSTYVSYMQGLEAGGIAPVTALNKNEILKPFASEQYEFGGKATLLGLDINVALFRLTKTNQYLDLRDNIYKQDGKQQHQGIEITVSGKLTNNLTLIGGGTILDAEILKANNDISKTLEGKIPENIPASQASANLEYALPWIPFLTLHAGIHFTGERQALLYDTTSTDTSSNPSKVIGYVNFPIASYITVNTGLRFEPMIAGVKTTFSLTVSNLANEHYWSYYRSASEGLCLGLPRIISLSAKVGI
ncbi:MAG: hypothetical protein A2293_11405 [Elusimicrobia bacterium RIFOXYB2_FULL_49_7]|nr:MAG: hypothetical protein A2293_11405 [Elusimicrobia bacterium RIFOXYB2_FULL_49_7]